MIPPDWLWIPITIFAALAQTVRNAAQRHLTPILGTLGATLVRFLTIGDARNKLAVAGLHVGRLEQRFEGKPGTVLAQHPAAGELVSRDRAIDLTISGTLP